jgi:hypothetical protein
MVELDRGDWNYGAGGVHRVADRKIPIGKLGKVARLENAPRTGPSRQARR